MPQMTEQDLRAAELRDKAHKELVDFYIDQAIRAAKGEFNEDGVTFGFLNVRGHEIPDPTVLEPPLGYVPQPDLMEQMRRMVQREISRIAEDQEFETFAEADDFDIDDDPVDYSSPYEEFFDPLPGSPAGPAGPDRQDPNTLEPDERGGGGAEPPSGQTTPTSPSEGAPSTSGAPAPRKGT